MGIDRDMEEFESKRAWAMAMGGPEKVGRVHAQGKLTARERIEKLLDPDTFFETGMLAHAPEPEWAERSPGDGIICGFGKIDGRIVAVSASDQTVLAGSDGSEVASRKNSRVARFAHDKGYPHIELGEGGGGRIHNLMGWEIARVGGGGSGVMNAPHNLAPEHRVPMLTAILGNSFGGSSFRAGASDWVVMTKTASISISSPRLVEASIGQKSTLEELGGAELHGRKTGQVDMVADSEEMALSAVRDVLSYLPSRASDPPPVKRTGDDPQRADPELIEIVPESINRAFDITKIIRRVLDGGVFMPIKADYGRSVICGLGRLDGHSVGVIANNSMYQAGVIGADGAVKMTKFIRFCDTFNIPLLFFHDVPGVLIGKQQEEEGIVSKIMDLTGALSSCKVPRLAVIVRKSYGLAYLAMSGSYAPNTFTFAWPTARIGFMAPDAGVRVAYGRALEENELGADALEAKHQALMAEWTERGMPWEAAGAAYIDDVIDPRQTRWTLVRALEVALGHIY